MPLNEFVDAGTLERSPEPQVDEIATDETLTYPIDSPRPKRFRRERQLG
jgi:hypothetical protein